MSRSIDRRPGGARHQRPGRARAPRGPVAVAAVPARGAPQAQPAARRPPGQTDLCI